MKMINEGRCWAEPLGGCAGPITKEHLITQGVFRNPSKVRVPGTTIKNLKARILCDDHNGELGRTADLTAIRIVRHFETSNDPMRLPGSRILRPPVSKTVSGTEFGRWLCKTHCNLMVVQGLAPEPAYMQYAFLRPLDRPVYFYFHPFAEHLTLGRFQGRFWQRLHYEDDPGRDCFRISLGEFETIVSTRPLVGMVDRIRELKFPTPLGDFRICFDWSGEPNLVEGSTDRQVSDATPVT